MKLIERRSAGKVAKSPGREEEPAIINLMDALRQSVEEAKHGTNGRSNGRSKSGRTSRRTHARRKTG